MKRTHSLGIAAAAFAGTLVVAGCGGASSGSGSGTYDAASTSVVNPSDHQGGTLVYEMSSDFDSMDPGNTYYAYSQNFTRLFATPLLTFDSVTPGQTVPKIVPDLATDLGTPSDNLTTWTYHIRQGLKFSNGEPITAADVKYAVARSNFAPDVLNKGPVYFQKYLINPNNYPGPYKDPNLDDFKGITTPDDHTVVFHLQQPFAEFDDIVIMETPPVPPDADTGPNGGVNYEYHYVSSGPYMLQSYDPGKQAVLVKNPNWTQAGSPQDKQLVDKIIFRPNITQSTVDSDLLNGSAQVDLAGTGVSSDARARILSTPTLKTHADDPLSGFEWYAGINSTIIPNVHCRKAIEYAVDKTTVQAAYGGAVGGSIATDFLPPWIDSNTTNTYPSGPDNTGDLNAAKNELAQCGSPAGFTTSVAFRSDRPKEKDAAVAVQAALARVGIQTNLFGYPSQDLPTVLGSPASVHQNHLGIMLSGWQADFPTGYGFLFATTDPQAITQSGNYNFEEETNPAVTALFNKVVGLSAIPDRAAVYRQIDDAVMQDATIIPLINSKSLIYRPDNLTNVHIQYGYGMYDYTQLGLK